MGVFPIIRSQPGYLSVREGSAVLDAGVRVSAKRQKLPSVLAPEQVKLGLSKLEFRDQLLDLLDEALGIPRGELGALRLQ